MKQILAFFILASSITVQAQTENVTETKAAKKKLPLHAKLSTMKGDIEKGWLYRVTDSSIILLQNVKGFQIENVMKNGANSTVLYEINARDIKSISLQKKGAKSRGALLGMAGGAAAGAIAGFASGDDPTYNDPVYDPLSAILIAVANAFALTKEEKALAGSVTGLVAGGLVGYIIGATTKKKFTIDGDPANLHLLHDQVYNRVLVE